MNKVTKDAVDVYIYLQYLLQKDENAKLPNGQPVGEVFQELRDIIKAGILLNI